MDAAAHPGDGEDEDRAWSRLHGDIAPSPVVRVWLRVIRRLAAGPVARIPPDVLSAAGVAALGAALLTVTVTHLPVVCALLVVAAGVLDGLDGAVALRTGRARPLGAVVDAVADRLGDLLLGAVLLALGAPLPPVAAALVLVLLLEYVRARAQSVGMPGVGAVTVAERPTRLIVVVLAALGSAVPGDLPGTGGSAPAVLAATWVVVTVVGMAQLLVGVRRTIPARFTPDRLDRRRSRRT